MQEQNLEMRVQKLEKIVFTMRLAIIIFIGFMIYDIISKDTGSDYVFAQKIKAREFVLLDSSDAPVGFWDYKDTNGFKMYDKTGNHITLTPDAVTFYKDRLNPVVKSTYD